MKHVSLGGQVLARCGLGPPAKALACRSPVPDGLRAEINGRLPDPVETGAYYIVGEALANAAKHANATVVGHLDRTARAVPHPGCARRRRRRRRPERPWAGRPRRPHRRPRRNHAAAQPARPRNPPLRQPPNRNSPHRGSAQSWLATRTKTSVTTRPFWTRPEPARWPQPRTSRSIAAGSLAGPGRRCWRRARGACSVNLAGGVIRGGGFT